MNNEVRNECVKALAYGHSVETVMDVMGVSRKDVDSITAEEVEAKRKYLREMGFVL